MELPIKVPLGLLGIGTSQHRGLEDKGLVLLGARGGLASRLGDLLPHFLAGGHGDRPISISEEEALLEELLDVLLGRDHVVQVVLQLRELLHLEGGVGLPLLGLELLLLDLGPGLAPVRRGLHQVRGLALRD